MKKVWLVACLFMGLVGCMTTDTKEKESKAEEGVLLKCKFVKGDVRMYKLKQANKTEAEGQQVSGESENIYTETVNNVEDGVATIEVEHKSMKMSMDMGGKTTSFDSTKKEDMEKAKDDPMVAPMAKILGKKMIRKMRENGEIVDIDLMSLGDDILAKSMAEGFKNSNIKFPDKKIVEGDKWSLSAEVDMQNIAKMKITLINEFAGIKDLDGEKCAKIKVEIDKIEIANSGASPLKFQIENTESSGLFYLSLDKGVLKTSEMKMAYDMIVGSGEKSTTVHMDINQEITLVK